MGDKNYELINIIFDNDYTDVDIIAIPEGMMQIIESLATIFSEWLLEASKNDNDYWVETNGNYIRILKQRVLLNG